MHPLDNQTFQAALGAIDSGDLPTITAGGDISETAAETMTAAIATTITNAQAAGSVVTASGLVLDGLAPHVSVLSLDAARVLAGAAHLVLTGNWLGRAAEADTLRDAARARIAALE